MQLKKNKKVVPFVNYFQKNSLVSNTFIWEKYAKLYDMERYTKFIRDSVFYSKKTLFYEIIIGMNVNEISETADTIQI